MLWALRTLASQISHLLLRHNSTNVTGMALEKLTDAWSSSFQARAAGKEMAEAWEKTGENRGDLQGLPSDFGVKTCKNPAFRL
jgi:hypothetical protein